MRLAKDRYGVSWQIVPATLDKMLYDPDTKKSERMMNALLQMKKLDIRALERAYEQTDLALLQSDVCDWRADPGPIVASPTSPS